MRLTFCTRKRQTKYHPQRKPRERGGKAIYRGISHDQVYILVAHDRQKILTLAYLGVDAFGLQNWMKRLVVIYLTQTCYALIRGGHSVPMRIQKLCSLMFQVSTVNNVRKACTISKRKVLPQPLKKWNGWTALIVLQPNICNIIWLGFVI